MNQDSTPKTEDFDLTAPAIVVAPPQADTTCSITLMRRYKGIAIRLSNASQMPIDEEGEVALFRDLQKFVQKYEDNCDPALYDPAYNAMAQKPGKQVDIVARLAELEAENARLKAKAASLDPPRTLESVDWKGAAK